MLADITCVDAIYIVCGQTDMRKSIDGLCAIIQNDAFWNTYKVC
ncbi:MAG: IS66 family insertion sequence element accessory protein TnpB [Lachnospiraceae bacterium]|nr:IS66 family insertion sequence element accessory protein TnpB [Lachnospiraceae bacterium]